MRARLRFLGAALCALAAVAPSLPGTPLGDAEALYQQDKFAAAKAMLEPIAAAEPANAAAAFFLGMSLLRLGGPTGLDQAHVWLSKATRLEPSNEEYLAEHAGVCLLMADRDNSFSLALEGRDGMERAIEADPTDLEAREGLMRFYAKAPWPLGSVSKARSQAAEIGRRDPARGKAAYLLLAKIFEKKGEHGDALSATEAAQSLAQPRRD